MNQRQKKALARFQSIKGFMAAHDLDGTRWSALRRELNATLQAIVSVGTGQEVATIVRGTRARQTAELRRRLRRGHMLPIRRDVRLLLRKMPGVAGALVVPHASASNATLVAAADKMAKRLAPYRKFLEAQGLPVGFLAAMRTTARDLASAVKGATSIVGERSGATAALKENFSRLALLESSIEGQVMIAATTNPRLWRLWVGAKKTPKKRGRPPKPKT